MQSQNDSVNCNKSSTINDTAQLLKGVINLIVVSALFMVTSAGEQSKELTGRRVILPAMLDSSANILEDMARLKPHAVVENFAIYAEMMQEMKKVKKDLSEWSETLTVMSAPLENKDEWEDEYELLNYKQQFWVLFVAVEQLIDLQLELTDCSWTTQHYFNDNVNTLDEDSDQTPRGLFYQIQDLQLTAIEKFTELSGEFHTMMEEKIVGEHATSVTQLKKQLDLCKKLTNLAEE